MDTTTLIASAQGLFGSVRYYRDDEAIWLVMDHVTQGGIRNDGAPFFPHTALWCAAVHPGDRVLMVGLGIGEGILAILATHPDSHVTCLEIDPLVIRMTLDLVPGLGSAIKAGRLGLIEADADTWLATTDQRWSVGLLDAYQTGDGTWMPMSLLDGLLAHCDRVVVNVLGDQSAILTYLENSPRPYAAVPAGAGNTFFSLAVK